jgi:hypothetical protein
MRLPLAIVPAVALALLPLAAQAEEPPAPVLQVAAPTLPPSLPPPPVMVAAEPHRVDMGVVSFEGGPLFIPGRRVGGLGRISMDVVVAPEPNHPHFAWGARVSLEGWGGSNEGGFALPMMLVLGAWSEHVIATVGGGFNLFTLDGIDKKTGGGILSPRATARVGFTFGNVYLAVSGEAQRHWAWGLDDVSMFSAAGSLGVIFDQTRR